MGNSTEQPVKRNRQWLWALIIVFLINVVLAIVLLVVSNANAPEMVIENPYENGKLETYQKQLSSSFASGWSPELLYSRANNVATLRVLMRDSTKVFVPKLSVKAEFYRPSNNRLDRKTQICTERDSIYSVTLQPPLATGLWNVLLSATDGRHHFNRRLNLFVRE